MPETCKPVYLWKIPTDKAVQYDEDEKERVWILKSIFN
jgi:hypothetical protein